MELRVGQVVAAEKIAKADKLLETYSYTDIKLTDDLRDEDFDPDEVFF